MKKTITMGQLKKLIKESVGDRINVLDLPPKERQYLIHTFWCDEDWPCKYDPDGPDMEGGGWTLEQYVEWLQSQGYDTTGYDQKQLDKDMHYGDPTYNDWQEEDELVVNEEFGDDETIPADQVNEFEDHLRTAQKEVEAAARIVCSSHNPAARQAWNALYRLSEDIANVIHTTHRFRKWD